MSALPDERPKAPAAAWIVACAVIVVAGVFGAMAIATGKRRAAIDATAAASTIPGFPHAVDPSALVAAARDEARLGKDARLTAIRVDYAGADGRVDLRAVGYEGRVAYSFIAPPEATPSASGPLGAPAPTRPTPRTTSVIVASTGMSAAMPSLSLSDEGIADPECTVAQIWAAARARGAPPEAIAVIEYGGQQVFAEGRFHRVTRWHFAIEGTRFAYDFADPGCGPLDTSPKL